MTFAPVILAATLLTLACDDRRPNGEACLKDGDCQSENCRRSVCAPVVDDTPMTVGSGSGQGGVGGAGGQAVGAGGSGGNAARGMAAVGGSAGGLAAGGGGGG